MRRRQRHPEAPSKARASKDGQIGDRASFKARHEEWLAPQDDASVHPWPHRHQKEKAGVAPAFAVFVIAGLVPVIHVWLRQKDSRGWPGHLREDALRAVARP
jgi:hypothetical protein